MTLAEVVGQGVAFLVTAAGVGIPLYRKMQRELGSDRGEGSLRDLVMQLHGRFDEMDKRVTRIEARHAYHPQLDDGRPSSPSPRSEPPSGRDRTAERADGVIPHRR